MWVPNLSFVLELDNELFYFETFEKPNKSFNFVISAEARIKYFQILHGFRIKPGMTEKGVMQRFKIFEWLNSQPVDKL